MLNSLVSYFTSSCVKPSIKKSPLKAMPTVQPSIPHILLDIRSPVIKTKLKPRQRHTHTLTNTQGVLSYWPTLRLEWVQSRECDGTADPGWQSWLETWLQAVRLGVKRQQPDSLCRTPTRFNHSWGNIKYTCTVIILHHGIFFFFFPSLALDFTRSSN